MHKAALDDLDAAEKEAKAAGALPRGRRRAPVLRAYCHYDIDRLAAEGSSSPQAQLAGLLAYCSARLAQNGRLLSAKVTELLPWMPECYRLQHGQCISGDYESRRHGAAAASKLFGERLYGRLAAMPGLPADAAAIVKQRGAGQGLWGNLLGGAKPAAAPEEEFNARAQLMTALLDADRPADKALPDKTGSEKNGAKNAAGAEGPVDRGEPSWSVLARLIRDVSFMQAWDQVETMGATDEFLAQVAPLVADDPYRGLLTSRASDPGQRNAALEELVKANPRVEGLEYGRPTWWTPIETSTTPFGKTGCASSSSGSTSSPMNSSPSSNSMKSAIVCPPLAVCWRSAPIRPMRRRP